MGDPTANGWKATRVTIGLLVAMVAAVAGLVTTIAWTSSAVDTKVGKAITSHDTCAKSHGDIRERCRRSTVRTGKAYRAVRVEMEAVRQALTEQRVKLDLVLDKRTRRTR